MNQKLIEYLESRMALNREILNIEKIPTISFLEFMNQYEEILKALSEKADSKLEKKKEKLELVGVEQVLFTDSEIAFLMSLIQKALEMGLNKRTTYCQSEKEFIQRALLFLSEKEPNEELERWIKFFTIKKYPGLMKKFTGKITLVENFCIIENYDGKVLYQTDETGKVRKNVPLLEENVLISSNLYIGTLHKHEREIYTVFLKKEDKMEAIDCDYQRYPTDSSCMNYVETEKLLNEFMQERGYFGFTSSLYTKATFMQIINIFDKIIRDERKEKMIVKSKPRKWY